MPKLKAGAPALKDLRFKNWEVKRMLPDIEEIAADAGGIIDPVGYLGAQYAYDAAMIWQESSQLGLGAMLTNLGMPTLQIFRASVDAVKLDVVAEVTDKLVDAYGSMRDAIAAMKSAGDASAGGEAMSMAVEGGVGIAVDLTTSVPVAGWVIKLVWAVGKFFKNVVQIVKSDRYGEIRQIYPESNFNPHLDNIVVNGVIGDLRTSRDWTRLFGPPRLGEGQGNNPDFWVKVIGEGARETFRVPGRNSSGQLIDWLGAGWVGMVPSTAVLHQGIRTHGTGVTEIGSILLPSSQNLLFWVWKEITGKGRKASPALYTIDTKVLADSWAGYISDLHVWLGETDEFPTATKESIMRHYNGTKGARIFGWGESLAFGGDKEMENYLPVREADTLRKRQMAMLDTLLCAYVDESFVAIKEDKQLRDRWLQRRKQLLEHPARCDVDLEVVPDEAYRDELKRRRGPGVCAQASLSLAFLPPPTPPDGQGGAAGLGEGEDPPGTKRSGGMGTLLLGAAALGGLVLAHKKGWI